MIKGKPIIILNSDDSSDDSVVAERNANKSTPAPKNPVGKVKMTGDFQLK